jgi:RimJ/RimL family protein N-acetyltransferase
LFGIGTLMITPVTLEGSTVSLVPLTLSHLDQLCDIGLDVRLWRATTIQVSSREQMEAYIGDALAAQMNGTTLPFVIIERSFGRIVGMTRFHSAVPEQRRIEIGFSWVSHARQRTCVNTEAKYLLLRHAFERLNCVRVEFKANVENEQSCRALARIGAIREGILRCYRVAPSGATFDLALFSIIAADWPHVRCNLELMLYQTENTNKEPNQWLQDDRSRASLFCGA